MGVESGGVDAVFIDMPVMLLLPLFPAHEEAEDATFLAELPAQQGANTSSVASTRAHERSLTRHTASREVCPGWPGFSRSSFAQLARVSGKLSKEALIPCAFWRALMLSVR